MPNSRNGQRAARSGRSQQNGTTANGHAKPDSTAKQDKENGTVKSEFKNGDTVLFSVRTADVAAGNVPAITLGEGIYKKPRFDPSSLSSFLGVHLDVVQERLDHALKFPFLRPAPLDVEARSHPFVKDGRHFSLMDDCTVPKMISRRRAMVLKSFVFRRTYGNADITKDSEVDKAIKKLKAQYQSLLKSGEKNLDMGLYTDSDDHVSQITRAITTKSFPALSSITRSKYTVEWEDELGASWKDENVVLVGFEEIQSANEWGKHRFKSRGPASSHWFGLRDEDSKGKENGKDKDTETKIAFDKNLFWSVAFFFCEVGTCGLADWDADLKEMRSRANEMTTKSWEFNVTCIEPSRSPVIGAGCMWKKAKDCANDNFKRGKKLTEVLIYYKAAIKELAEQYGDDGNEYREFMKSECAKLYTNMAVTFYKIHDIASNPRNDLQAALGDSDSKMTWDDSLEESFNFAKKAIECNKFWWKGYFYAARALNKNNQKESSMKYIKLMMTNASMMSSAQDQPLKVQEVIDFLVDVKYFTNKNYLKESSIWSLITHKTNVYVICPKGAGHFKHPVEAIRALRKSGKLSDRVGCSLIIRPGTYNLDVDQSVQDDREETAGTEENFIALSQSKSEAKISAAIVLLGGEAVEMIGDFPVLDYPTYDCGARGAMDKSPPITFHTTGKIGQHMFVVDGEGLKSGGVLKSSLTLRRLNIKHNVRHPYRLLPSEVPPSIIKMQGDATNLRIQESKVWTATQPALHASGGEIYFVNSSLTDSGGGFICENDCSLSIEKSLIADVTTTCVSSFDSRVRFEDTLIRNIGEWDLDYGIISRGDNSTFQMENCQYSNPKIKEAIKGAILVRGGHLDLTHCDFHGLSIDSHHGIIDVRDHGSFSIEWNEFGLGVNKSNTCALKLVNFTTGKFRFNRIQNGWKALFIEDHMQGSSEELEIGGNSWETITGKKILVHEFESRASIDGFRSNDIESVPEKDATAKKVLQIKAWNQEDNRRKKLCQPQPKEVRHAGEEMKEISRLRKIDPLRCQDVKIRFHLDRKCTYCVKYEHVIGPCLGTFKVCDRCKYRGDMYCSRECQLAHWPIHKHFCKKNKEIMKSAVE